MTRSQLSQRGDAGGGRSRQGETDVRRWLIRAFAGVVLSASWSVCSAAVLTVGDHGTYLTIQAAISTALGAGSTEIRVEQGTYVENIDFLGKAITVRSSDGPDLTIIDGGSPEEIAAKLADKIMEEKVL